MSEAALQPGGAAAPARADRGAPSAAALLAGAGVAACWCVPLAVMLAIIPRFEAIFRDFGIALPATAVWVIDSSRWLRGAQVGQAVPGVVLVAPLLVVIIGAAALMAVRRRRSWLLMVALILIPLASIPVIVGAMYAPLAAMIQSLQSSGP